MEKPKLFSAGRMAEFLQRNKKARLAVYAFIAALALLLFLGSGVFDGKKQPAEAAEPQKNASSAAEDETAKLEARLEALLSEMAGVGRVKVMLTFEQTGEQVLAFEDRSGSGSEESRPATVTEGGKQSPIVLTEHLPRVRGVVVLAEGAGNIAVRLNIIAAVGTVLGVDEKNVEVFVMAG